MKYFLVSLFFLFTTSCLPAQELHLVEQNAPQQVPFAQPFALQFALAHTPNYQVDIDESSLSKDFEVSQLSVQQNSPGTTTYDLTVFPFTLGKSTFTVTFQLLQDGKALLQLPATAVVNITRAQTYADQNLREIRNPSIPAGWFWWVLGALLTAALCYVLYWWRKQLHEGPLSLAATQDSRPCQEIAFSKIDALLGSGLWENSQYKLFYITLSDILREYLWRRFHLDTSADTSAELLRRAKNTPQLSPLLYPLRDFLNSGDLVKFAKAVPSEEVRNKDIQILREIVTQTTPQESSVLTREGAQ